MRSNPKHTTRDLWLGVIAFLALLAFGAMTAFPSEIQAWAAHKQLIVLIAVLCALVVALNVAVRLVSGRTVRSSGDSLGKHQFVTRPWVIDGDTIDDLHTGERYRLANIDAPETGDNAKCFHERLLGEDAKRAAMQLVHASKAVTIRSTMRRDQYGRTVAHVFVDGRDLGEALIAMGLAVRWSGRREPWCGVNGPLVQLAAVRGQKVACKTCAKW